MAVERGTRSRAGTPGTIEDVLELAAHDESYELIDGVLVEMVPPGFEHGGVEGQAYWVVRSHVEPRRLGFVVVGDVLFRLDPQARYGRAADVAFVRRDRIPRGERIRGAFPGAPDFAIEVISPGNAAAEVQEKVDQYLRFGTSAVLLLYPDTRRAVLWRSNGAQAFGPDDEVDLGFVVPELRVRVGDLFPPELTPQD